MSNRELYAKYEIGDRVLVAKHNKTAVVEDVLYSNKADDWMFIIKFDDSPFDFAKPVSADELKPITPKTYRFEVFQADNNVMTAVMYEIDGDIEREVDRQHGHIIHKGEIGVAQAASYAMKKIYTGMNDGKYIGLEDDGYVR